MNTFNLDESVSISGSQLIFPSMLYKSYLDIFDDKDPLVVGVVLGAEALVRGEGALPRREDVHVSVPHP